MQKNNLNDKIKVEDKKDDYGYKQKIWRRFRKHKLGMAASVIIIFIYLITIFAGFLSPYNYRTRNQNHTYAPPTK
ncbi:MAG: ABC transporter permease, partial [Bacillota bacterium]